MEEKDNRGLFLGVIGVLTLIVAIIGATFAYFSASVSSNDNAVAVQSATIAISYIDGQVISADNLIPATENVAKAAYANATGFGKCLDDNKQQVCAIFGFTIENNAPSSQELNGSIFVTANGFTNLKYIVYDVTDSSNPVVVGGEAKTFGVANSTNLLFGDTAANNKVTIAAASGETPGAKSYNVLIYLNETSDIQSTHQNELGETIPGEEGQQFYGTVNVTISGANSSGQITGQINGVE